MQPRNVSIGLRQLLRKISESSETVIRGPVAVEPSEAEAVGVVRFTVCVGLRRDRSPTRSKALFEPTMGIGLVAEGFHFPVSAVAVQLDGFNERAVRFQVKNRNSHIPSVVLQGL